MAPHNSGPILQLLPEDPEESQHLKLLELVPGADHILVGRVTGTRSAAQPSNGFFDSKVLSRQHAEIWATEDGHVMICDVGSSNGTFVNGERLSPESEHSQAREIFSHDTIVFGVNIYSEENNCIVYKKVAVKARVLQADADSSMRQRFLASAEDHSTTIRNIKVTSPQRSRRTGNNSMSNNSVSGSSSSSAPLAAKALQDQIQAQSGRHKNLCLQLVRLQRDVDNVLKGGCTNVEQTKRVMSEIAALEEENSLSLRVFASLRASLGNSVCSDDPMLLKQIESLAVESQTMEQSVLALSQKLSNNTSTNSSHRSYSSQIGSRKSNTNATNANVTTGGAAGAAVASGQKGYNSSYRSGKGRSNEQNQDMPVPQDMSWTSTFLLVALVVVVLAVTAHYVSTTPEMRDALVKFSQQTFKYDPSPLLDKILIGSGQLSDQAYDLYVRLHKALLPAAVGL